MLVDCHPKMVLDTRLLKLRHRNYISCTYLILKKGLILKKKIVVQMYTYVSEAGYR